MTVFFLILLLTFRKKSFIYFFENCERLRNQTYNLFFYQIILNIFLNKPLVVD